MNLNITNKTSKNLVVEVWENDQETELMSVHEFEVDDELSNLDIKLKSGQYVVVRGVE